MIAKQAGITAAAIYNYFPTKADIYRAVVDAGEYFVADAYEKIIKQHASPVDALCAIFDFNMNVHSQFPELLHFFGHIRTEISRNPELAAIGDSGFSPTTKVLRKLIQQARAKGEISGQIPAHNIEQMLFACIIGISAYGITVEAQEQRKNMLAFRMLIDGSLMTR
jgi:AcrR family transcriptional regulator